MCTYSMIARDWMNPFSPNHIPVPPWKPAPLNPYILPLPSIPPLPTVQVTPDIANKMLEILKKVDELDKKLGRLDCKLDVAEKKQYVKALRKVAGKKCPCKKKKVKKKAKKVLLTEQVPGYAGEPPDYGNYGK